MQFRSINVARCFITSILVKDNQEHKYFFFSFSTRISRIGNGKKKKKKSSSIVKNSIRTKVGW